MLRDPRVIASALNRLAVGPVGGAMTTATTKTTTTT
jgi:hypothetical protein